MTYYQNDQQLHTANFANLLSAGLGFGAFGSVDFALVMDVITGERDKAKDLAVWTQVTLRLNKNTEYPVFFRKFKFLFKHSSVDVFADLFNCRLWR